MPKDTRPIANIHKPAGRICKAAEEVAAVALQP